MESEIIKNPDEWEQYLTRPFSLFGTSLWYVWYSEYVSKIIGEDLSSMLCIEIEPGLVRHYRKKVDLIQIKTFMSNLVDNNIEGARDLIEKGEKYQAEASLVLAGEKVFSNLKEAFEFFFQNTLHVTVIPYFLGAVTDFHGGLAADVLERAKKLRGISNYPELLEKIVIPMTTEFLRDCEVQNPEVAVSFVTYNEVLSKNFSCLEERIKNSEVGQKYVFVADKDTNQISWHADTSDLINKIEGVTALAAGDNIRGTSAFTGVVTGTVRVIKTNDGKGIKFDDNNILVSISSNPNLMHLIKKAAAIVTDEGGITCHAAVISRELGIPCVIGTKIATQVLKDGMEVEVDADKGIVKIINDRLNE